jgi:DNA polymerase I-like protein with 3'-5' exonuclease and polymerase domains
MGRKSKHAAQPNLPGMLVEQPVVEFVAHLNRPPVPEGYKIPTTFPNFVHAKRVTIDAETHDPELNTKGCGLMRGNAYVVGWAVQIEYSNGEVFKEYYPMRHDYGDNCSAVGVEQWLADNMNDPNFKAEIVGANVCQYDGMFMHMSNVRPINGQWRDIQWSEPLLDENAPSYSLESQCKKYGLPGKEYGDLTALYGPKWIQHFREVHPYHARGYALGDVDRPGRILDMQIPKLKKEKLLDLFHLESRLTPFLHYMRKVGVRVDKQAAENFNDELMIMRDAQFDHLSQQVGFPVSMENYGKRETLVKIFDTLRDQSIAAGGDGSAFIYPYTEPTAKNPNGLPSFKKDWLDKIVDPTAKNLLTARSYEKSRSTFVEGYILDYIVNGRLHCEFNPLKQIDDEEGARGTASGRFSSTNPNLQNIPSRDPFLGPILRSMFLPEEGADWWSLDYSQIEYRLLIHFAYLTKCIGADVARKAYMDNPKMDFHTLTAELMQEPLVKVMLNAIWNGVLPDDWKKQVRKIAKNINFGLAYGMGVDKLAVALGLAYWEPKYKCWKAKPEAKAILDTYHKMNPYVRAINKAATKQAQLVGYIKTYLGRRSRFEMWELDMFGSEKYPAYPLEEAKKMYVSDKANWHKDKRGYWVSDEPILDRDGNTCYDNFGEIRYKTLKRAGTHKALNRVLQGSAADMMKLAMVRMWEAGIFDEKVTNDIWCHLTIHDELDGSVLPTDRGKKALAEVRNIMETCMPLEVPVLTGGELGANWHEAH